MLAERNLVISARNMSDRWSGDPNALKLHDLDVLCAVLGCGIGELLIPEPDTDTVAAPAPGPAVDESAGWPARHDRSSHAHGRAGHCHRDDLPTLRHPISATSRRDRTYCTNRCSALASYYRRKAGLPVPRAGSIPRCPPGESAVRTAAAKALQFTEAHGWDRSSARLHARRHRHRARRPPERATGAAERGTNPTVGVETRQIDPEIVPMTDQEIRVIEQLASTPAQRVALTLAAEHAARTGAIRTLTLDELDMPNPRITLNGYHQRLGELTHRVLTAWLDHRRATWPLTPNRHVLLNAKTVPRTEALVMTAIEENIVLSIPSTAPARAAALIPAGHELGLDVLLSLPCTVIDELDTAHARARWAPCCNTAATHRATSRLPTLFTAHKNEVGRS